MLSSENNSLSFCQHYPDLPNYHHLTELNLSNLQLIKIDAFPLEHFPHIRSLDLSSNQLKFINQDWSISFENKIEYLNLRQNKLQTLLFIKNFRYFKNISDITENLLENNERFLSLDICPTIEHLIDFNRQIHNDRIKLEELLRLIDHLDNINREIMIEIIEKQEKFSQFHLSPLGNYFIEKKINNKDFHRLMNIENEKLNYIFQPIKFLRSHHQCNNN